MIVVYHHLGLGDHIDCNGMVRYFAELYGDETIEIFAKKNYHTMVEYMFRDHDRINVNLIESDEQSEVAQFVVANQPAEFFKIGHEHYPPNPSPTKNCWEYFYEQLDIDTNIKCDYFYVKPDKAQEKRVYNKLNPNNEEYIFVHEESSVGVFPFNLDTDMKIIRNDIDENIFHFTEILRKAKEIHVMESSYKSMVEHFPTEGKLFFHNLREHPLGKTKKDWEIIEYAS